MAPEPTPPQQQNPQKFGRMDQGLPRWALWILLVIVLGSILSSVMLDRTPDNKLSYTDFVQAVEDGQVRSVTWSTADGSITGHANADARAQLA